jgi:Trk-type K+ transport system membrane component
MIPALLSAVTSLGLAVGIYNLSKRDQRRFLSLAVSGFIVWTAITILYVNFPDQDLVSTELYKSIQIYLPPILLLLFCSGFVVGVHQFEQEYLGKESPEERILNSEE